MKIEEKMKVELIPVLEIYNNGQDNIPTPRNGPSWEFQKDWEEYFIKSNLQAGFSSKLKPYLPWTHFYEIGLISDRDLQLLINREIEESLNEAGEIDVKMICFLEGGLILKINGQNLLFPQCCSKCSYIDSWLDIIEQKVEYFYQGHPSPILTVENDYVIFDLSKEYFAQPKIEKIKVLKKELDAAIIVASSELELFAERIQKLNDNSNLKIEGIGKMFVFGK